MDSFGVEKAYKSKSSPTSIMTVVKKDGFTFNSQKFDFYRYIKSLPATRDYIHKLVGISNWKVTGFEKKEILAGSTKVILVKIKGDYLRRQKDVVDFEEWHHFYGETFLQLQLIRNKMVFRIDEAAFFTYLQSQWL